MRDFTVYRIASMSNLKINFVDKEVYLTWCCQEYSQLHVFLLGQSWGQFIDDVIGELFFLIFGCPKDLVTIPTARAIHVLLKNFRPWFFLPGDFRSLEYPGEVGAV